MKIGELCYIPQDVLLMQFDDEYESPRAYYKTDKPLNVVVMGEKQSDTKYMEVFCNGQKWYVHKKHIFEVKE